MLYILFAASKHRKELKRMQQYSLPIHRYKAIKTWMRECTYSTTIFVMCLKSMEDRTENTVPFKLSSQDLHTLHTDRIIWSILHKSTYGLVTAQKYYTLLQLRISSHSSSNILWQSILEYLSWKCQELEHFSSSIGHPGSRTSFCLPQYYDLSPQHQS